MEAINTGLLICLTVLEINNLKKDYKALFWKHFELSVSYGSI